MPSNVSLFICCFVLIVFGGVSAQRNYTVTNKCPTSVNLYIGGILDSTLATGVSTTKNLGVGAGFFYSDANGGSASGPGTRAGFFGDSQVRITGGNFIRPLIRFPRLNRRITTIL